PLLWALGWLKSRVTIPGWIWQSASALGLAGLLAWGAADRLGGLYWAATHLTATTEERAEHVNETLIRLVRYVRDNFNPGEVRLYLLDERLRYYLADYNTKVGYPYYLVELEGYDYIIYSSSYRAIYGDGRLGWQDSEFYNLAYAPLVFEPVCEVNGVHIMRILRTTVPAPEEIKAYEESSL
nr:hypothetical protein [Anaerolineae bacterium]